MKLFDIEKEEFMKMLDKEKQEKEVLLARHDYEKLRDDVIDMIHLREKINSKLKEFKIDAELPSGCQSISDVLGDIDAHFDEQEK
tara:strand:- start:575 stop:829 length:255 start_codon:yes stop_codon:yes gene_type:complete